MRVVFVFPNYDCPPGISIGVAYMSTILKQKGHSVKIIHICDAIGYSLNENKIVSDIISYYPDIIAFSVGENHFSDMCIIAKKLKDAYEHIPIVFGGVHITLNTLEVMKNNLFIDYCIVGEGEDALPELLDYISDGNIGKCCIPNVWSRCKKNEIVQNKMRPLRDISTLPYMDLESWEFEKITKIRRGWVNISMNRGCPYRCSFCHNVGEVKILKENFNAKTTSNKELGYLRLRSIDDMIAELCHIKKNYPFVTAFSFIDDTFTFAHDHMMHFFRQYKEKVKIPYICLTTVNDLDEQMIKLMAESGCDMIRFGIESATPRIKATIIRRNFSNDKVRKIFSLCKTYHIRTFAYNIIAHPTETKEEILDTLRLNASIIPNGVRVSLGYPYIGTPYYDIAKEMGQIESDVSYSNYSTYTKFKFSKEEKLWIDKCRCYFKLWLNIYLENACSIEYKRLVEYLEQLAQEQWEDKDIILELQRKDKELTEFFRSKGVTHYTSPFPDRPDIVILYDSGKEMVKRDEINEH